MYCKLCPNDCNVDRNTTKGLCGSNEKIRIAKFYLHKYEEPIICGGKGSGTIFFCGCSLKCVFCQNYELSRNLRGKDISVKELSDIFKKLEDDGACNINLVTPTHYSDKIIEALDLYRPSIPILYNTHGYEKEEIIESLFDKIDIFLPDIKFFSPEISKRYTGKEDYFKHASNAIKIMANKPLVFDEKGILKSGTIARHLVLPMNTSDSIKILDWWKAERLDKKAYINIMSQYTPFGALDDTPELKRKITAREYEKVTDYALLLNIDKCFYQKRQSADTSFIPNWDY